VLPSSHNLTTRPLICSYSLLMSDIEQTLEAYQQSIFGLSKPVIDWTNLLQVGKADTLASVQEHLDYNPQKRSKGNIIAEGAFWTWVFTVFVVFLVLLLLKLLTGEAPKTVVGMWGLGGIALSLTGIDVYDKIVSRKENIRASQVQAPARIVLPQPVQYKAKLVQTTNHLGGVIDIHRTVSCLVDDKLTTMTVKVLSLPLPVCGVVQLADIMSFVNEQLRSLEVRDNLELEELLKAEGLNEGQREATLHALIEQSRAIREYNSISAGAFDVINSELEHEATALQQQYVPLAR
jgi:hypothetical protein